MNGQPTPLGDRLARIARFVLLACIAVITALIILGPRNHGQPNPVSVGSVHAEGGICAAPGYLMMPVNTGGASKFFVCDTNKQVICVYETKGDHLRLVSVRKFDRDLEIFDGSIPVGGKFLDGHANGMDRKEAGAYADAIKESRAKAAGKKAP
ncbi:MAG: hypothetical protein ABSE73_10255 [Planctomycetota bacterium]